MLLQVLLPLSVAGTPVEDLAAILHTDEGRHYRAAAVCAPLEPVLGPMGAILLLLGAPSGVHQSEAFLDLGRMLDPRVAETGGVDLGGSLLLGTDMDGGPGMAAVPFSGGLQEVEELLGTAGSQVASHPDGGWTLTPEEGGELRVHVVGDHLVFRRLSVPVDDPLEPMPWLIRGLPEEEGCAIFLDVEEGLMEGLPSTTAAAVLPSVVGRDARVRFSSQGAIPPAFGRRSPPARTFGSSSVPPRALLTVNVPGLEVLRVPSVEASLGLGPQEHAALASLVYIEPGMTVAGLGTQKDPQVVATMGVLRPSGRSFSGAGLNRRIVRMLWELGMPVRKLGRRAFVADVGGTLVYGATDVGRLSVGTDSLVVAEALVGHGEPWNQPEFVDVAAGRPVALAIAEDLISGGLVAGLEGTVQTGGAAVEVLDPVIALASPAYVALRSRARAVEVERLLPTLMAAQEDHRDRTGHYLALPPAPRPLGLLSTRAVHWVGGPGWDDLDFAPAGDLRGTYWVEVDEGGQVRVHGAIDGDGDGDPALWILDREGMVIQDPD